MADPVLVVGIALALVVAFLNGYNDSGSVVATMVSSDALSPRRALAFAACTDLVGPFLFGSAVASTIGQGVLVAGAIDPTVVLVALAVTILWSGLAGLAGLPASTSHTLVGSLVGAGVAAAGVASVQLWGLAGIIAALLVAPALGLLGGYGLLRLTLWAVAGASPKVNEFFKRAQVVASVALGLAHGTNDAQKAMGVIGLLLLAEGATATFAVPDWSRLACAASLSLGTATGGWRVMKTLGARMYRIRPVHGFAAQTSATVTILLAGLLGKPVSTTQVVGSAILGAGAADRPSMVRWSVARSIVLTWLVTLPATALLSAALYLAQSWLTSII
jgi:PiT family inorganic phosphate transporter